MSVKQFAVVWRGRLLPRLPPDLRQDGTLNSQMPKCMLQVAQGLVGIREKEV